MKNLQKITQYAFFESKDTLETIFIYGSALDEDNFPFSTLNEFSELSTLIVDSSNIAFWPAVESSSIQTIGFVSNHVATLPAGN